MSPVSKRESDVRACTLAACHRVGLYEHLTDPESDAFLDRLCTELVEASQAQCPVGPPYNEYLNTFREKYRACLEEEGYKKILTYLQRLCTNGYTWRRWSSYHSRPTLLRKT